MRNLSLRFRRLPARVWVFLAVMALMALPAFAAFAQTPEPPMTQEEITSATYSIVQTWGLIPFLLFFALVGAAAFLFKRMKSAAR